MSSKEKQEQQQQQEEEGKSSPETGRKTSRKVRRAQEEAVVSGRRLAAGLWRLRLMEVGAGDGGAVRRRESEDRLGFQVGRIHSMLYS